MDNDGIRFREDTISEDRNSFCLDVQCRKTWGDFHAMSVWRTRNCGFTDLPEIEAKVPVEGDHGKHKT